MTETGQVSASSDISIQSQSSGEVLSLPITAGSMLPPARQSRTLTRRPQSKQPARSSRFNRRKSARKIERARRDLDAHVHPKFARQRTSELSGCAPNGYNDISAAFLDLPGVITGLNTILHGTTVPGRTSEQNENAYSDMTHAYDSSVSNTKPRPKVRIRRPMRHIRRRLIFKATPRDSDNATIEKLISESYQTAADISDALKASTDFLNFVNTTLTNHNLSIPSTLSPQITTLTNYTNTTNNHVAALSNDAASVTKRASAGRRASVARALRSGADPLDIQSSQLSIQEKQNALAIAEQRARGYGSTRAL